MCFAIRPMIASSLVTCVCETKRITNRTMAVAMRMRKKGRCLRMNATRENGSPAKVNADVKVCSLAGLDEERGPSGECFQPGTRFMIASFPFHFVWVLFPSLSIAVSIEKRRDLVVREFLLIDPGIAFGQT